MAFSIHPSRPGDAAEEPKGSARPAIAASARGVGARSPEPSPDRTRTRRVCISAPFPVLACIENMRGPFGVWPSVSTRVRGSDATLVAAGKAGHGRVFAETLPIDLPGSSQSMRLIQMVGPVTRAAGDRRIVRRSLRS